MEGHSATDRLMDLRDASIWMGCSPAFLLKMKRWGWLRSMEDMTGKGRTRPAHRQHYPVQALEVLAWDLAFSLSFYDILKIRTCLRKTTKEIAAACEVPSRVVEIVYQGEEFNQVMALMRAYIRERGLPPSDASLKALRKSEMRISRLGSSAPPQHFAREVMEIFFPPPDPPFAW